MDGQSDKDALEQQVAARNELMRHARSISPNLADSLAQRLRAREQAAIREFKRRQQRVDGGSPRKALGD